MNAFEVVVSLRSRGFMQVAQVSRIYRKPLEDFGRRFVELMPIYSLAADMETYVRINYFIAKKLGIQVPFLSPPDESVDYLDAAVYQDPETWFLTKLDVVMAFLLRFPERKELPYAWCWLTSDRLTERWKITKRELNAIWKDEFSGLLTYTVHLKAGFTEVNNPLCQPPVTLESTLFALPDVQAYEELHQKELEMKDARRRELRICDRACEILYEEPNARSGELARRLSEMNWGGDGPGQGVYLSTKNIQQNVINGITRNTKAARAGRPRKHPHTDR